MHVSCRINKENIFNKAHYIFSKIVFNKCKLCIVWNWFMAKIISISQKYLFCGYSKWYQIKLFGG